jgi:hypothetical protein
MPIKVCRACEKPKDTDNDFPRKPGGRFGVAAVCKQCDSARSKRYYAANREQKLAARRAYVEANKDAVYTDNAARNRRRYASDPDWRDQRNRETRAAAIAIRRLVLSHYAGGEPHCACCDETADEFLQLDHVNGGGGVQRAQSGSRGSTGVFYWLRRNGFPEGYRVLCANCNFALGRYGYCPHTR